jgi:hypothetical protein
MLHLLGETAQEANLLLYGGVLDFDCLGKLKGLKVLALGNQVIKLGADLGLLGGEVLHFCSPKGGGRSPRWLDPA